MNIVQLEYRDYFIVEDAVAVKDRGHHIAIWIEYSYGKLNMLQCMKEFCGWTMNQHYSDRVHDCNVVAVKKQLSVFLIKDI